MQERTLTDFNLVVAKTDHQTAYFPPKFSNNKGKKGLSPKEFILGTNSVGMHCLSR